MTPADLLEPVLSLMESNGEAALLRLDELVLDYSSDPRLPFMRGSVLAGLERYDEARVAMQTAVDLAPDFAIARFQLGFLILTSGDPTGAHAVLAPLLNLPAEHPLRLFVEGLGAMVAGRFDEAVTRLQAGIERNTELPPLNRNMAILIQEILNRPSEHGGQEEVESGAHFLLKQYSFKDTRH